MQQFRPWRYRPVFPGAVYPVDRIARYTRSVTTFNMDAWTPALPLEGYDPLLWLRADQGISTGGARQFYSADKTSLQHADNAALSVADSDFLIATWVYVDNVAAVNPLVTKYNTASNLREYYLSLDATTGRPHFVVAADGGAAVSGDLVWNTNLTTGRWYFIVAWHDSVSNTVNLQVDNATAQSTSYSGGCNNNTSSFAIGAFPELLTPLYCSCRISRTAFLKNSAARAVIDSAATRTEMYNLGRGILSGNLDLLLADLGTFTAGVDWDGWNLNETDGTADARSFSGLNDLTPTFGELLTNGDLETWASASDAGSWTETVEGTSTIAREATIVHSGTYAASLVIDALGSLARILQDPIGSGTRRYTFSCWARVDDATGNPTFQLIGITGSTEQTLTTSYAQYSATGARNSDFDIRRMSNCANRTIYIDDASLKATDVSACDGPSSDIAPDTGSVGTAHGQLIGFADSETVRSTDTADGSPNPTVLDQSGNSYNGLMTGFAAPDTARSAHGLTGVPGQAITFDGTNDYIQASSVGLPTAAITASLWCKFTAGFWRRLCGTMTASNYVDGFGIVQDGVSGKIQFFVNAYGVNYVNSLAAANDGNWHHIAGTYDGATISLYVDGVLQGTAAYAVAISHGTRFWVSSNGASGSDFYDGDIADPRIYSTALTAPEIAAIAAGDSGLTGSPVLRYDFNEADTRTLTTIGAGTSLVLDGVDDRVSNTTVSMPASGSLSLWMYSTDFSSITDEGRVAFGNTGMYVGISARDNNIEGITYNGAYKRTTSAAIVNTWYHVVLTWDGANESKLYVDGALADTNSTALAGTPSNLGGLHAGSYGSGGYFAGKVDDVQVFNSALSLSQVGELYAGTAVTGATPSHKWTFDEETSLSVTDGDPIAIAQSLEGNRYQFLNATASKRPEAVKPGLNGKQGLRFDSVDDMLVYVGTILSGTTGSAYLIFTVEEVPNAYQTILAQSDTATATKYVAFHARGNTANPHIGYEQVNADTADLLDGSTEVTDNLDCAVYWDCDGTVHRAWLNGTAQTLNADTGANNGDIYDDTTGEDLVAIGGLKHTSETNHAGVVLYEIYEHPLKLTDASKARIAAYVLREYGLTL